MAAYSETVLRSWASHLTWQRVAALTVFSGHSLTAAISRKAYLTWMGTARAFSSLYVILHHLSDTDRTRRLKFASHRASVTLNTLMVTTPTEEICSKLWLYSVQSLEQAWDR